MSSGTFGSLDNKLKAIELLNDSEVIIDDVGFYSGISTNKDGQGAVVYSVDNGFTYGLGAFDKSLEIVKFSSDNGIVNGDTYAENIIIDSGKSAIFTGTNNRVIDLPDQINNAAKLFNYQTVVNSSNFYSVDSNAGATFKNATLFQAPIIGGSMIFEDDVWLQHKVTNTGTVTLASNKTTYLQTDFEADNIIANQNTITVLNDLTISGDLTGSDITHNLGSNQVTYVGSATPESLLTLNVIYNPNDSKTNSNTNSGNIVIVDGSSYDLTGLTGVQVILTVQSDPTEIVPGSSYPIMTGTIIPGEAASFPFNVIGNDQGKFERWTITNDAFTLYTQDTIVVADSVEDSFVDVSDVDGNTEKDEIFPSSVQEQIIVDDPFIDDFVQNLSEAVDGDAKEVKVLVYKLPKHERKLAMNRLLPKTERSSQNTHRINRFSTTHSTLLKTSPVNLISPVKLVTKTPNVGNSLINSGASTNRYNRTRIVESLSVAKNNTDSGRQDVSHRAAEIRGAEIDISEGQIDDAEKNSITPSSGDESSKIVYGVWGAPYYGKAKQKEVDNVSGYKTTSVGGSIGVDTAINDNLVLGGSFTHIHTKLRYQDEKLGNISKVSTNMFSAYGVYNFMNNWFAEGIASYAHGTIKTEEQRNILNGTEMAYGRYHSLSYSGQIAGGYNYIINNYVISPMFGLRFSRIRDSSYAEQGTSFQNLTIGKRQYNKVEAIAGVEVKTSFIYKNLLTKPQIFGFVNYDFKGKTPTVTAYLDGLSEPLPVAQTSANKKAYNLGCGIEVSKGRFTYGVNYGLDLAKKYIGHNGTLSFKVNF